MKFDLDQIIPNVLDKVRRALDDPADDRRVAFRAQLAERIAHAVARANRVPKKRRGRPWTIR